MKCGLGYALGVAAMALGAEIATAETVSTYREMCDASAAVALDKDHFIVADDELNVLRIYRRGQPASVRQVELSKFLGTKPTKESDIEGAARVGDTIYWISSHGTNSEGEVQDRRRKFFATELAAASPPTVNPVGKSYSKLFADLTSDPKLTAYGLGDAATRPPKTKGALNIEGLADFGDGKLLIGFRNPLPGNKALLIPLENPAELVKNDVNKDVRARFGTPFELDLGGLGVRSVERIGTGYLIVAGPYDAQGEFKLLRWSGKDGHVDPVDVPLLKGLYPEALFAIPDTGDVQILSDDGKFPIDGGDCKDAPRAKQEFRSIVLKP